jgi:hypothetical protein
MQGFHPFGGKQHPNEPHAENVPSYNMEKGIFPFDQSFHHRCTPPPRAPDYETVIPAQIRELFRQAFLTDVRPTAEVWTMVLKGVLDTFIPCANDPTHMHPQGSECTFCSWNSRLSSAATGKLITVQPKASSKKKKKQPAQVSQSVPPTGNPTYLDGTMWGGSLMFVLSIIALYFLPGDGQFGALSYLYEYFTWPFFGAIAILIGVFIQGVRTSDWNLFFVIGLVSFLVVAGGEPREVGISL